MNETTTKSKSRNIICSAFSSPCFTSHILKKLLPQNFLNFVRTWSIKTTWHTKDVDQGTMIAFSVFSKKKLGKKNRIRIWFSRLGPKVKKFYFVYCITLPPLSKFSGVRNVLLDSRRIFWRQIRDWAFPRQLEPWKLI